MRGDFVWFDLSTTDPGGARAFYPELLGWEVDRHRDAGASSYSMWRAGGRAFGGVMAVKPGARPGWLGYVAVDDVDATVARATELGGRALVPGTDIENDGGRFAVLLDPVGAVFALYASPNATRMPDRPPVSGHELSTPDPDGAFAFYGALFGWAPGAVSIVPGAPGWRFAFTVDDCRAAAGKAEALGGRVLDPPYEVGPARAAVLADPQGVRFGIRSEPRQVPG